MVLKKLVTLLIVILLVPCVVADLNWKDTLKVGQAKLYQKDNQAYTIELVYAQEGKARFFINGKELTPPIYERDEYKTHDGSTIQPLNIDTPTNRGKTSVDYYFLASMVDMIEQEDSHAYRSKIADSTFDYNKIYTEEEHEAVMEGYDMPEDPEAKKKTITEVTERIETVEGPEIVIEEQKQIFSIGWMNKIALWIKGLFS